MLCTVETWLYFDQHVYSNIKTSYNLTNLKNDASTIDPIIQLSQEWLLY